MRRTVPLLLALFALALPSAALAQSAGDEQYADPFGQVNDGGGQGQQADQPTQSAPAPAQSAAPATSADQAAASQEATGPTLPRTGLPALLLAAAGALLLAGGTSLRRLVS